MTCLQTPSDTVFIPPGWLSVFQCMSGVLVYCARASILLRSAAAKDEYSAMAGAFAVDKLPAHGNMMKALESMEPAL